VSVTATELTQARLRELLHYDPTTGVFTWLPRPTSTRHGRTWNTRYVGTRAGTVDSHGHVQIKVNGRLHLAHRLAWLYAHGEWPVAGLDHINGVRDDNRLANLRPATESQNAANRRTPITNTSGFKGVSWHKDRRRWQATIMVASKQSYLGLFDTPEAAHAAYAAAAREHHGEFARTA
jgi:hypothetical protein